MSVGISVFILAFVLFASLALGLATAWGVYALTKRRWVWLLAPIFAILWLGIGTTPVLLTWTTTASTAPVAAPPAPMVQSGGTVDSGATTPDGAQFMESATESRDDE
jgi:hypothetical protein